MTAQPPQPQLTYVNRPEIPETFADALWGRPNSRVTSRQIGADLPDKLDSRALLASFPPDRTPSYPVQPLQFVS